MVARELYLPLHRFMVSNESNQLDIAAFSVTCIVDRVKKRVPIKGRERSARQDDIGVRVVGVAVSLKPPSCFLGVFVLRTA